MNDRRAIVIGSGIAGVSAALALARRDWDVRIVEGNVEGGATWASAGIIAPWGSAAEGPYYDLYSAGADFYPHLLRLLDELDENQTDYRQNGAMWVNSDAHKVDEVFARITRRRRETSMIGDVELLAGYEVRERFPALERDDLSGVHVSGGGRVDGRTIRSAILGASVKLGARSERGSIASLTANGAGVAIKMRNGTRLSADLAVVAAGAWSGDILQSLGVEIAIEPQRGQIIHFALPGTDTTYWPSVHPMTPEYAVAFDASRVAFGATREPGTGFDPRVTAGGIHHLLSTALKFAPGLAEATINDIRVGLRPVTPDGLPIVGQVPGAPVYISTGFGAAGLTMAPLCGEIIAGLIEGDDLALDPAPYRPHS